MIGQILRTIWDVLFPSSCLGCEKEGSFLCDSCLWTIPVNEVQACPVCKKPSPYGKTHDGKCAGQTPLSGLIVAARYTGNPLLEKAITQFKYRYSRELSGQLGKLLHEVLKKNGGMGEGTIIVPIPLHPSRKRWRGFNQAEALADEVGKALGAPVVHILKRKKKTRQQAKLSRTERLENVKGAFALSEGQGYPGARILLVDDVSSTLATLEEAAKVLRDAGYTKITGAVLARG